MYKTIDLARILGVQAVTIRKYAGALESAGYSVLQSGSGHRLYSDKDATVFQEFQALRKRSGLSVAKCAEVIVARHSEASGSVAPAVIQQEKQPEIQHDERYNQLIDLLQQTLESNRQLQESNAQLHKRIEVMETKTLRELNQIKDVLEQEPAQKGGLLNLFGKKNSNSFDPNDIEHVYNRRDRAQEEIYSQAGPRRI